MGLLERFRQYVLAHEMIESVATVLLVTSVCWCLISIAWYILDFVLSKEDD